MNKDLQTIIQYIQQSEHLSVEEKTALLKAAKAADKELEITAFKLERTEKVKRTTAILLEETIEELEQKRKAVEAQNRELEIESSLERVRTVAMSMNKHDDLLHICEILYAELHTLGFNELRNSMINIYDDDKSSFLNYDYSANAGKTVTLMSYNFHPLIEKQVNITRNASDAFYEFSFDGKELKDFRELRKNNGEQDDPKLEDTSSLHYYFYSIGTGSVGISTYNAISDEKKNVLKRFRNVFELAYRRYLDIEKAEAQAREAQIEAALERVRSRTMAMQHSDELLDVASILFQQVKALGVPQWNCGFDIWDIGDKEFTYYPGSPDGKILPTPCKIPLTEHPVFRRFDDSRRRGDDLLIYEKQGEEQADHYRYMLSLPGVGDLLRSMLDAGFQLPTFQIDHVANFAYGNLIFITYEHFPKMHEVFKRFAKVFEQTYTRFLDLQKAEAQAREAQIQLALERVRARTMAMQKSDELGETASLLFQQIKTLGIESYSSGFTVWENNDKELVSWMCNADGSINPPFRMPATDIKWHRQQYESWKKEEDYIVHDFTGKEMEDHYRYLRSFPLLDDAFKKSEKAGIATPSRQVHNAFNFSHGNLLFITLQPVPESHDIFKRFAKIFDQTYTRFLDLKKAEAQARESQIQLALERVRARTMAMQRSDELSETASLLFKQVSDFGIKVWSSAFQIWNADDISTTAWASAPDGSIQAPFRLPYDEDIFFKKIYEARQNRKDFFVMESSGKELEDTYHYMFNLPGVKKYFDDARDLGFPIPKYQITHCAFFLNGYLMFITYEPCPEMWDIFKRFAKVFEQSYTRFLDLQKAEEQAREAQIEAALERVRSRSLAMHHSDELREVISIVLNNLQGLDIDMEKRSVDILTFEEGSKGFTQWLASPEHANAMGLKTPYFDNQIFFDLWSAREKGIDFYAKSYSREEKNAAFNYLFAVHAEMGNLPKKEKDYLLKSEYYELSCALEKNSAVGIANFSDRLLSSQEHEILKRFARVFEQSYIRFLDLQKAEAQAREAKIEAALEKVRSRTLAMQKSDELSETAAVVFRQLIHLGIEPNRLYIGIINDDSGDIELWATDEDGSKVSTQFTGNIKKNITIKKMYDGWVQQKKSIIIDMEGKELTDYFRYLSEELKVPFKLGLSQKRRVQNIAYFAKGFIGMASADPQPEETVFLLERFAAVFNLTYTRFNDLQIAEHHAEQAELDLIKLKEEKKRTENALNELQATQKQLIQSEKMASLGELTAGIAHEIQNPLNFVNNFSEVNIELIEELKTELATGNQQEAIGIAYNIKENEEKINHHGKRADAIVKAMLQHSRSSSAIKEPTDINALADEYLRLAYHGLRAKDKSFDATMKTDYNESIGNINIIPQDIGRVILNLITNAFYAVTEKQKACQAELVEGGYEPTVYVSTKKSGNSVLITVSDNGNGIPQKIVEKIFQPFFTTKPTGQGTGLGLSLSYDIVKAHGGEIKLETKEREGTEFIVQLPIA